MKGRNVPLPFCVMFAYGEKKKTKQTLSCATQTWVVSSVEAENMFTLIFLLAVGALLQLHKYSRVKCMNMRVHTCFLHVSLLVSKEDARFKLVCFRTRHVGRLYPKDWRRMRSRMTEALLWSLSKEPDLNSLQTCDCAGTSVSPYFFFFF